MPSPPTNPVLRSARREAALVLVLWAAVAIYSVGYCYLYGYGRSIHELTFVLGFPDWIFWGVIAPWGVCYVISLIFSFVIIQDDPLGRDMDEDAPRDGESEVS